MEAHYEHMAEQKSSEKAYFKEFGAIYNLEKMSLFTIEMKTFSQEENRKKSLFCRKRREMKNKNCAFSL